MGLWQDLQKYRVPVLLGAGGVVALTAYNRARESAAAAAQAAPGAVTSVEAQGLNAQQALAVQQGAFMAGGGLGLQGAQLGLQTAERGLDLAGIATMGAQAVTGDVIGLATSLGERLGSMGESAIGVLPSFAPYEGIAPQPTQPAPTAPAPTAPAPTQPAPTAPAPTTTTRKVNLGYRVHLKAGSHNPNKVAMFSGTCGGFTGMRMVGSGTAWSQPAQRIACDTRGVQWKIAGGGYSGWNFLSWRPEGASYWYVTKGTRTETYVNGVKTTHRDSWVTISKTGS